LSDVYLVLSVLGMLVVLGVVVLTLLDRD